MLRIQFVEIPEEGLLVNVNDVSWFPEDEVPRCGDLKAEVFLERDGERVLAVGAVEMVLRLTCDRCLAEFTSPHKVDFRLVLEVAEGEDGLCEQPRIDDGYNPGEIEVVALDGPSIDLGELLYQQTLLAMPRKVLCRPDCLGLCGQCGADQNVESCDCPGSSGANSFAALGRLLKH